MLHMHDMFECLCIFLIVMLIIYVNNCSTNIARWYYHYTDCKSMEAIKSSGCIKQSTDTERDAAYGKGAYLNGLHPSDTTKEEVAVNNYTSSLASQKIQEGKVDSCIAVLLNQSVVKDFSGNGRNIVLHPGTILLSAVNYHIF